MRGMPKSQVTVLLAIGLIAGSLCLLAACGRSGVHSIEDMKAGDCYNKMKVSGEGDIVPCDTPHDVEVVAANTKGVFQARLTDCLGVPTEEEDAFAAERGLKFYYHFTFDAYLIESETGKLTEAICR